MTASQPLDDIDTMCKDIRRVVSVIEDKVEKLRSGQGTAEGLQAWVDQLAYRASRLVDNNAAGAVMKTRDGRRVESVADL